MGEVTSHAAARVRAGKPRRQGTAPRTADGQFRPYDPGGYRSTVCPRTQPRRCRGQGERNGPAYHDASLPWSPFSGFAPAHYPHYYLAHEVRFTSRGRPRAKRICLDCHNNELLAQQIRWSIEQGYGRADGVQPAADDVLADAPAAADPSASGRAIELAGVTALRDEAGRLRGIDLVEPELLPETKAALQREIAAGILAGEDRGEDREVYEAQMRRYLGKSKTRSIVV